jgi:hypothetical protein
MSNRYVKFVSDEHFIKCVGNLYKSYQKAKFNFTKSKFFKNKVDIIKLSIDANLNDISEEDLVKFEILRQIDKSINNSIGSFHEQVLGGVVGYVLGQNSGYDIKAINNSLFADIKNKHNTMNSSSAESLFQKLKNFADKNKSAKCYWVQILAKSSFEELWVGDINGKEYSHSRVYKISGDRFYTMLTGEEDAFFQLYKALPKAILDFRNSLDVQIARKDNSVITELKRESLQAKRSILDQISFENYVYYAGFKDL